MQRVNAAYRNKDLLKLLELQLEVEQIDPAHINNIAEDRRKYINKVLQEQLGEIRQEIDSLTYPLMMQLNIPPYQYLSPEILMAHLRRDTEQLKNDIEVISADLARFKDLSELKSWLKTYRIPKQEIMQDMAEVMAALSFLR